jgi:hypothetical protein
MQPKSVVSASALCSGFLLQCSKSSPLPDVPHKAAQIHPIALPSQPYPGQCLSSTHTVSGSSAR